MERISSPAQLPGAEIRLPALLVQVREHEKQQQGYNARQDQSADDDGIHEMTDTTPSSVARGEDSTLMVAHVPEENNNFGVTYGAVRSMLLAT